MNKKVKCKNKIEFMNYVAEDCLKDMSVEDKEYLMENPVAIKYHFHIVCIYGIIISIIETFLMSHFLHMRMICLLILYE